MGKDIIFDAIQQDLMSTWECKESLVVSIVCLSYNHEEYIGKTIDGFLMQETNFSFEIIIHDDASTDNTGIRIKEYYSKYPEIIRPIIQKINQLSQGDFNPATFAASFARGKFIAYCEGDDYWTDTKKLAKQVAAFKKYPDCDICFHPAYCLDYTHNKKYIINNYSLSEEVFSLDQVLRGGGSFCPSASLMFRRHVFENFPSWITQLVVGDYYYQVLGAKRGGAIYLPDVMSTYRYAAPGSMSNVIGEYSQITLEDFIAKDIRIINKLGKLLGDKYQASINSRKAAIYMGFSFIPLGRGNFSAFRRLVESSWAAQKRMNSIQTICYAMRKYPLPLMLLLKIKRRFLSSSLFFGLVWGTKKQSERAA